MWILSRRWPSSVYAHGLLLVSLKVDQPSPRIPVPDQWCSERTKAQKPLETWDLI